MGNLAEGHSYSFLFGGICRQKVLKAKLKGKPMPYRRVEELAGADLRFDAEESPTHDLYPGRPMHTQESVAEPPSVAVRQRRPRAPPPSEHDGEVPIEGIEGVDDRNHRDESGYSEESPIDFSREAPAPPPQETPESQGSSNVVPILVVVFLIGVGGYLIYRSTNKSRF